jgi:hypothetical protein
LRAPDRSSRLSGDDPRKESTMNDDVPRVDVDDARQAVDSGRAVLVCGYADETKCSSIRLAGSLTLSELSMRDVPRDRELIFYCG